MSQSRLVGLHSIGESDTKQTDNEQPAATTHTSKEVACKEAINVTTFKNSSGSD